MFAEGICNVDGSSTSVVLVRPISMSTAVGYFSPSSVITVRVEVVEANDPELVALS